MNLLVEAYIRIFHGDVGPTEFTFGLHVCRVDMDPGHPSVWSLSRGYDFMEIDGRPRAAI